MKVCFSRRRFTTGLIASTVAAIRPADAAPFVMTPAMPASMVPHAAAWLAANFGDQIKEKLRGTPFSPALVYAIACQESGYVWFRRSMQQGRTPQEILRLLVLDNVSPRLRAFPRDTATFTQDRRYTDIANDLIRASDASRVARGISPTGNLLYGYGIFQYDLQHIERYPTFWRAYAKGQRGLWGDVGACTERLLSELNEKYARHSGDLDETVRAYNGSGRNAVAYSKIVRGFEREIAKAGL